MPDRATSRVAAGSAGVPVLLLALLLVLLTAAPAQGAARLQKVGDFNQPVAIAAAPGDYSRLYVVQQGGLIRVVRNGVTQSTPFADLSGAVLEGQEEGLLGLAFAPDFQSSRLLYVYFTGPGGVNRVEQLTAAGPDRANPGRRNVITLPVTSAGNHNGGDLHFGPDGYLYLGPGDGGAGESANAQALTGPKALLGKILRIAPGRSGGHSNPAGNPFGNEIWAYGLRNPWRFSFDRATGDLTIGDVGEEAVEEIDYAPSSTGRGRGVNYGWNHCEGSQPGLMPPCNVGTRPVIEHTHDPEGFRTIIGGYVIRDRSLPSLYGRYVYGDTSKGELWSARLALPLAQDDRFLVSLSAPVSFGEDTAGCVYVSTYGGGVYRLVENSTQVPCPRPPGGGGGDTGGPQLKVRVPKRQRVRKRHGAIAYARCDEACTVKMTAKLLIGGHSYRLRSTSGPAGANVRIRLKAKLTKRASRRLRRALRRHRRAKVSVRLRARDAAGNRSRLVKRKLHVRR
jgi:glucose/sorbosone dehydrogenase